MKITSNSEEAENSKCAESQKLVFQCNREKIQIV